MAEAPLVRSSTIYLQGLIFIILIAWSFMGFEIAQYRLLTLYESPFEWIFWATLLFISMLPVLSAITWRMKTNISYNEPTWDLREREITMTEYRDMMKQYRGAYQHVLSTIDYPMILVAAVLFVGAILFPFVTMSTSIYLIAATPIIFGLFVLPFGIVFANVVFKFIPNKATQVFSISYPKSLSRIVRLMRQAPGISWTGVHVTLGEASGYFTVSDPTPVARIEDIESVAKLECLLGESSGLINVRSLLQLDSEEPTLIADESLNQLTPTVIAQMVKKTLLAYIEAKGESELLEEVLEEVEIYLKRLDLES
ncbi:MAG: hypothetical protein ACXAAQ_07595 [Candidatus Thorarchaeota archaeon]